VDRTEWSGCGQWIANAPEHTFVAHPLLDECLDEGGLARARLAAEQDESASAVTRPIGQSPELIELVIALSELHRC
jgi:hypothetical protein